MTVCFRSVDCYTEHIISKQDTVIEYGNKDEFAEKMIEAKIRYIYSTVECPLSRWLSRSLMFMMAFVELGWKPWHIHAG